MQHETNNDKTVQKLILNIDHLECLQWIKPCDQICKELSLQNWWLTSSSKIMYARLKYCFWSICLYEFVLYVLLKAFLKTSENQCFKI